MQSTKDREIAYSFGIAYIPNGSHDDTSATTIYVNTQGFKGSTHKALKGKFQYIEQYKASPMTKNILARLYMRGMMTSTTIDSHARK